MGKKRNQSNYRELYSKLYEETCAELADLKSDHKQLNRRYEEAVNRITELETRIKTQARIIEDLEGENSDED